MDVNQAHRRALKPLARRIFVPWVLAVLLGAALSLAGCGKGGGPIVGKEPLKQVIKVENNVGALSAWAASKVKASALIHIDSSDDMTAFPSSQMEEMKKAAAQLVRGDVTALDAVGPRIERGGTVSLGYMAGRYKRVVWVIPSSRAASEAPAGFYRNYFVERRGFPAAAVSDFKVDGKCATGTVTGVPITITRLADLVIGPGENAIIDIDLHYFIAVKGESPAYRLGTKTLLEFLRELGTRGVKANIVTVNLSNQNNMVPMDMRYYGDLIRQALMNPDDLNGPIPDEWRNMMAAEDSLGAKRYASAEALYDDLAKTDKDNAGLQFSLGVARGFQDKGDECRAALLEAYRVDGEYLKGFFQLARVLADAGKLKAGLSILDTPDLTKLMAAQEIDYQRGVFYYTAHRPFDAITYLSKVSKQRPKDFGVNTILYRACREAGDKAGQLSALQKLIDIDDARVRREMPWVYAENGTLFEGMGHYRKAREMYEKYIEAKPSDSLSTVLRKRIETWKAKKLITP